MPEQIELLAGAVTKLRHAIHPLVFEQLVWDGTARIGDSLYKRMRDTQTTATNTCGAPAQASKAPTRMDILAWFCDIDATTAEYPGHGGAHTKLQDLHDKTWTPDDLQLVKAITRRCEAWAEQARHILGDAAPSVPLRKPCPLCEQLWHRHTDGHRDFALKATASMVDWHVTCHACKTLWVTDAERALLLRMLDTTGS
jgi:hypothetical protein